MLGDLTEENGPEGVLATYLVDLKTRLDNYPYFPGTWCGGGGGNDVWTMGYATFRLYPRSWSRMSSPMSTYQHSIHVLNSLC